MRDAIATAYNGTKTFTASATDHTLEAAALYVGADMVLSDLEVDGEAADVRATYIDVVTATFPAGTLIVPIPPARKFTKYNMASGTVTAIR